MQHSMPQDMIGQELAVGDCVAWKGRHAMGAMSRSAEGVAFGVVVDTQGSKWITISILEHIVGDWVNTANRMRVSAKGTLRVDPLQLGGAAGKTLRQLCDDVHFFL